MKLLKPRCAKLNKGAQTSIEFAIMGSIVLTALLFLAQQGFIYNARQGLEMYAFRQALKMSKTRLNADPGARAIDLTVIRELPVPSLFAGISKQRITASASVAANPYDLWTAKEDQPQDIPSLQLMQIGEGMIQKGYFLSVPPTKIKVKTDQGDDWSWASSSVKEIDPQAEDINQPRPFPQRRTTQYSYKKDFTEDPDIIKGRNMVTSLDARDTYGIEMTFERDAQKIKDQYERNDWEDKIEDVSVDINTIPQDIRIDIDEEVIIEKANTVKN